MNRYEAMNRIADRCKRDKDRHCLIEAYYLIVGTGDHSHAYYFNSEREREAFEAKHPGLEIWELFYHLPRYTAPAVRFRTREDVHRLTLWWAIIDAKDDQERQRARLEFDKAYQPESLTRRYRAEN